MEELLYRLGGCTYCGLLVSLDVYYVCQIERQYVQTVGSADLDHSLSVIYVGMYVVPMIYICMHV